MLMRKKRKFTYHFTTFGVIVRQGNLRKVTLREQVMLQSWLRQRWNRSRHFNERKEQRSPGSCVLLGNRSCVFWDRPSGIHQWRDCGDTSVFLGRWRGDRQTGVLGADLEAGVYSLFVDIWSMDSVYCLGISPLSWPFANKIYQIPGVLY